MYDQADLAKDAEQLLLLGESMTSAKALALIAEIGVADHFDDSAVPVERLAERTGTITQPLRSLLRLLAGHGVFVELPDGRFQLTPRGSLLRSDHPNSIRSVLRIYGVTMLAVGHFEHTLRTGLPAFDHVYGKPPFEYYRGNPEVGEVFNSAMADLSRVERDDVLSRYDFSRFKRIVDVGGGDGTLLASVLNKFPGVTGVVFEQEHVTRAAQKNRETWRLEERMEVVAGDFFVGVPSGGDLYILKSIIHDWPHGQAVSILSRCHEAMAEGARLVLFERVIFPDNSYSQAKTFDVIMLSLFASGERTAAEFQELFSGSGFELESIVPVGSALCAVEAVRLPS